MSSIHFIALTILLSYFGKSQTVVCPLDLIFVIDESESIPTGDIQSGGSTIGFVQIKEYIETLVDILDVDAAKAQVRVGIVSYATDPRVEVEIGNYINRNDLKTKIGNIVQNTGGTNTGSGLHTAWNQLVFGLTNNNAGRLNAPVPIPLISVRRVIVLFSDGLPNQPFDMDPSMAQTEIIAQRIREKQWSGMLPANPANLAPVDPPAQQLPYDVFILSIFVQQMDGNAQFMMDISSGAGWFLNLDAAAFMDPVKTNTATQLANRFCFGGGGGGDVHFSTLDNVIFTFNGAGDYIYSSSEKYFDLHVRTSIVGRATTLAAIAIKDKSTKNILEIWWNGVSSSDLVLNIRKFNETENTPVELTPDLSDFGPFVITHNSKKEGLLVLRHRNLVGFGVEINYLGAASFRLDVPKTWKTVGLAGNNNGVFSDDMCDRKNKCLDLQYSKDTITNRDIHNYALDWKVLPDELIFEKWMTVTNSELEFHPLQMTYEKLKQAKEFCGKNQACIFDYLSVGSEEYALLTKKSFDPKFALDGLSYHYVGDVL